MRASFAQGNFERAATLFERAAEISPDDYQSLILLIQTYRSLGRDEAKNSAARRGVERAERELILHPEDPRPAYLGSLHSLRWAKMTVHESGSRERWLLGLRTHSPSTMLRADMRN